MKKFFKFLLIIIVLVVVAFGAAFAYFKFIHNVNLFHTIGQVSKISVPTNTAVVCPNSFSDSDMASAKDKINTQITDLILYDTQNGYLINSAIAPTTTMQDTINLTDKECGAVLNLLMEKSSAESTVKVEDIELDFELQELTFSNKTENAVDFSVVLKLDVRNLKNQLTKVPKFLLNKLTDEVYITTTITIEKTTGVYSYIKTSKEIKVNNLSGEETQELFRFISVFAELGNLEEVTLLVAGSFADVLIAGEDGLGFSKQLTMFGATDFNFVLDNETIYFQILK